MMVLPKQYFILLLADASFSLNIIIYFIYCNLDVIYILSSFFSHFYCILVLNRFHTLFVYISIRAPTFWPKALIF